MGSFCIITAAHNEEAYIERTIMSLVRQSVRPVKWIIVDDASTDATGAIIRRCSEAHDFIEQVEIVRPPGRHFGNKVAAFNRGFLEIAHDQFDYIGNLDADITLPPDYFEHLLERFDRDPRLGLAGGAVSSRIGHGFVRQEVAWDSVAGAVQFFRRACYEEIEGYRPLPLGGIDAAAEISARMRGWTVRTFPELEVLENRRTGSGTAGPLAARFKEGRRMHALGYGFLFFFVRCVYRALENPRVIGSMIALAGYLKASLQRAPRFLSPDAIQFLRTEQKKKLLQLLTISGWLRLSLSRSYHSSAVRKTN